MAVNKVVYGQNTLIDLTGDTVTPETLALGVTAHAADGSAIVGTMSILNAYPVGSIYMSVANTDPGTLFGGTWTSFGAGRVLVGVDPNDTDFEDAQLTGGEKRHTLTVNELASHRHILTNNEDGNAGAYYLGENSSGGSYKIEYPKNGYSWITNSKGNRFGTTNTGGGQAHNNLQPYITCYMWLRTA